MLFRSTSPETWQSLKAGYDNSVYLGSAIMGIDSTSKSKSFGIAIKTPSSAKLSANNITENGKVRNLRFKVEYKISKD